MSQESATRTVGRQEGPGAYRSRRTRPGPQAAQGPGGLDRVALALGGLTKDWRFDRMSTVVSPSTGKVSASFAAVAKHYGVTVKPCPPRRGNRKGVVEKANHVAAQRFWRTLPDDVTVEEAQARLERWCSIEGTPGCGPPRTAVARSPPSPGPSRCARSRPNRSRPCSLCSGECPPKPSSRSAGTGTPSRRSCTEPPCRCRSGSAPPTWTLPPPRARDAVRRCRRCSPGTGSPRPALVQWSATTGMSAP